MEYGYFSKIIETSDVNEVNELCSNGWYILCVKDNPNGNFIYSLGKKPSFDDLMTDKG